MEQRARLCLHLVVAVLVAAAFVFQAKAESLPCEQVRAGVAHYGVAKAVAWAKASGYSSAQISEARRCLVRSRSAVVR